MNTEFEYINQNSLLTHLYTNKDSLMINKSIFKDYTKKVDIL